MGRWGDGEMGRWGDGEMGYDFDQSISKILNLHALGNAADEFDGVYVCADVLEELADELRLAQALGDQELPQLLILLLLHKLNCHAHLLQLLDDQLECLFGIPHAAQNEYHLLVQSLLFTYLQYIKVSLVFAKHLDLGHIVHRYSIGLLERIVH